MTMEEEKIYTLRPTRAEDAKEIHHMITEVYEQMERREFFVCDSLEDVRGMLSAETSGVAACDGQGRIVGALLLRYPGEGPENLGRDIGLKEEELPLVVHMETAVVLPGFRGQGLQKRMILYMEKALEGTGFRYLMATAAPENTASMKSFLSLGYRSVLTKEKYGGLLRCILLKEKF